MTKFQKTQKLLSIIPYYSTIFILVVTYLCLWKHKASHKEWAKFAVILFSCGIGVFIVNEFLLTGQNPILNLIASALVLSCANFAYVDMQVKYNLPKETSSNCENEKTSTSLSLKKKFWCKIALLAGIVIVGIIVVFINISLTIERHNATNITDNNGTDDYSLAVLTREDIIAKTSDYTVIGFSKSKKGDRSFIDSQNLIETDYDCVSMSAYCFSGITVLHSTKTDSEKITLNITSNIESGNFEIVILIDGEYYSNVTINQSEEIVLNQIKSKTITIKIAGESAKFNIQVDRSYE